MFNLGMGGYNPAEAGWQATPNAVMRPPMQVAPQMPTGTMAGPAMRGRGLFDKLKGNKQLGGLGMMLMQMGARRPVGQQPQSLYSMFGG